MQLKKYLFFVLFLVLFGYCIAYTKNPNLHSTIFKKIGQQLFLNYHHNRSAIYFLQKSIDFNNSDFETFFLLGRVLFVENKLAESTLNFTKAIELNPEFKEAYYGRGLAFGFSSSIFLSSAEEDFKKYIEIENKEFEQTGRRAYGAWAGYNDLAWIHFLQGDFDKAEKVTRAGLEISNFNPWLSNMLGATLLEKGNCREAKIHLKNASDQANVITAEQFGEAYSGDHSDFYPAGLKSMRETIEENLEKCDLNLSK